ncbi:hypothetical protein HELRODRAFT_173765 [Helobdella robusta]|uniref:GH18 domain-containing protein n=1 Tax=Helobdella robusta TaxID=6412 RepID=T1F773_HELRO|nr:hypothetical protein HELRODRAFT_173765 [Helobdella robusta]ESO03464.1 hypothetical protein HELRODRAFT_173765 [Helobdella robusta]
MYPAVKLQNNQIETYEENDKKLNEQVTYLKGRNKDWKVMLTIDTGEVGSVEFAKALSSQSSRGHFMRQLVSFLRKFNFDGFDIMFRPSGGYDKQKVTSFIQEIRDEFSRDVGAPGRSSLQLSIAIPVHKETIRREYDLKEIQKYAFYF